MNDAVVIAGDANLSSTIDGEILHDNIIDGQPFAYYQGSGGTFEHDRLFHRDLADQHPISSITNLENALESRPSDVITNMDIHEILSH